MNLDNKFKSVSGAATVEILKSLLDYISDIDGVNLIINEKYEVGYPNYNKQFKMDFEIIFEDFENEKWLVEATSSVRSDRVYGVEFFADHIRKIDTDVKEIFLVTPDTVNKTDIRSLELYSNNIHSNKYKSFLSDVLTIFDFGNRVLYHATQKISTSKRSNILGKFAEEFIVFILNNENNLLLWNDYDNRRKIVKSFTFDKYKKVLESFGLEFGKDKVYTIFATKKIQKLKNKGYPKTDILVNIFLSNTQHIKRKISVKNTDKESVSVHQGSIDDLIYALKCFGYTISGDFDRALHSLQQYGGIEKLKQYAYGDYKLLLDELKNYNVELVEFFIFGENSPQVIQSEQIADSILYYKNFQIQNKEDYIISYLNEFKNSGQYGTPFKWTYQKSSDLGKSVQIKGFTNNKK